MTAHLGGPRDGEGMSRTHPPECSCPRCPPVVLGGPDNTHGASYCRRPVDDHRLVDQNRNAHATEALCRIKFEE